MLQVKKFYLLLQRQKWHPKWSLRLVWSGRQVFILVTRVQIPERLPPIFKTLTDNQAVRVFSHPKHPLPCQPRVNRFRDTCFLVAPNTSHKVPSLTRLTLSVDTPKKQTSTILPLTNTHQEHPHKPPSHPLPLTKHTWGKWGKWGKRGKSHRQMAEFSRFWP